ncbi:hypothetical protein P7C73_g2423, partial [Tremellales sp. Uapishka_1]
MSFATASLFLAFASTAFAQSTAASTSVQAALTATAPVAATSINSSLPQTASAFDGFSIPALSELTSAATTDATVALDTTYAAGATPTANSAAPALPTLPTPANYPALDVTPPTNSSLVTDWLAKIDMTKVPSYNVSTGVCSTDPGAITDGRCWWTCGGCTRDTDITECPDKYTWGLSYDDGPSPYTPLLLDYLDEMKVTTTFFVVGSRVISRPAMLQSEYMAGHQISVHTWSHPYLTTLTNEEIVAELGWTMKVIKDTIGVTPNTFRPPYGDIDDRVRAIAAQMGLTPIIWTSYTANGVTTNFDTTDWNIPGGEATGESSLAKFEEILGLATELDTGFIVLEHDLYQQTVDLAVGYVLPMALASGSQYTLKSIINCLGLPVSEAYIETSSNATTTAITSGSTTFFQASIGTATGSAVLPSSSGSDAVSSGSAASGSAASGSASASGSSASGSSGSSSTAAKSASGKQVVVPALASLLLVGVGMAVVA